MDHVKSIFCGTLKLREENFSEDLLMADLKAWDSLSHMELIVALEACFGFELTGDEIAEMTSIRAIRRVVESHRREVA